MDATINPTAECRVSATRVITSSNTVYSAWVPSQLMGAHSSLMRFDDDPRWWGRIGTERLPVDIETLRGEARITRVREWQEDRYTIAYQTILAAHPEARDGKRSMGEITLEDKR